MSNFTVFTSLLNTSLVNRKKKTNWHTFGFCDIRKNTPKAMKRGWPRPPVRKMSIASSRHFRGDGFPKAGGVEENDMVACQVISPWLLPDFLPNHQRWKHKIPSTRPRSHLCVCTVNRTLLYWGGEYRWSLINTEIIGFNSWFHSKRGLGFVETRSEASDPKTPPTDQAPTTGYRI